MLIFLGALLILVGLLFCMTIIGAFIGFPLIGLGSLILLIGIVGRRNTVITNVVQVASAPQPVPYQPPSSQRLSAESGGPGTKNCPACNSPNDPGSRFCNNCGETLSAS